MELVLGGLSAAALAVVILFVLSLRGSLARDRAESEKAAEKARADAEHARAEAARAATLQRNGARLRCLGCDAHLRGPLGPNGCPECHLESLVVTEAEYRRQREE